jgi:hypothetical protein
MVKQVIVILSLLIFLIPQSAFAVRWNLNSVKPMLGVMSSLTGSTPIYNVPKNNDYGNDGRGGGGLFSGSYEQLKAARAAAKIMANKPGFKGFCATNVGPDASYFSSPDGIVHNNAPHNNQQEVYDKYAKGRQLFNGYNTPCQ